MQICGQNLQGQQRIALERIMESISGFSKRLFSGYHGEQKAVQAGQSIYEYDKNGTVAKAYAEFTREVIQCGEKQRNKHESSLSR